MQKRTAAGRLSVTGDRVGSAMYKPNSQLAAYSDRIRERPRQVPFVLSLFFSLLSPALSCVDPWVRATAVLTR